MATAINKIILINEYISQGLDKQQAQLKKVTQSQNQYNKSTKTTLTHSKLNERSNKAAIKTMFGVAKSTDKTTNSLNKGTIAQKRYAKATRASSFQIKWLEMSNRHAIKNMFSMGSAAKKSGKSMLESFTQMRWALVNVAMAGAVAYGAFNLLIKPSIEFETALANVEKTTGFTNKQMGGLSDGLRDLSTIIPLSAKELADIAAVAGQLGIAMKGGSEAVLAFTATISMVATAMDLTAEEAATNMAKVANAFKLPVGDIMAMGSVINELENTTAAKGIEIIKSLRRVGSAATTLGISFESSAAGVTTLIEAGMVSERAGTRMRSLFNSMATNAQEFADIAGLSLKDYIMLLETDTDQALRVVIEGLNDTTLRAEKVGDAVEAAGKVGGFALLTLADNTKSFSDNLGTVQTEMKEVNSLIEEAGIKAGTTAGQFTILVNTLKEKLLAKKGFISDLVGGARMAVETDVFKQSNFLKGPYGGFKTLANLITMDKKFMDIMSEESAELINLAKDAGHTDEAISKMFLSFRDRGQDAPEVLDSIRLKIIQLKGAGLEDLEVNIGDPHDMEDLGGEIDKFLETAEEVETVTESLADKTREWTLANKELQTELKGISSELSNVKDKIKDANSAISNIKSRRFEIGGIAETDISHIIAQQELELNKAKFATLGLGTAEEFLRNASILTADSIEAQTQAILELNDATADGSTRYDVWQKTLRETIKSLLISSQDIDKDVTGVVKRAQAELMGITHFDRTQEDQFTHMEDNLDALGQAQKIFFGEEQEKLKYSESLREDRINGMNESAAQAITNLSIERGILQGLLDDELEWLNLQESKRDEIEENRKMIDLETESYYANAKARALVASKPPPTPYSELPFSEAEQPKPKRLWDYLPKPEPTTQPQSYYEGISPVDRLLGLGSGNSVSKSLRGADGLTDFERATTGKRAYFGDFISRPGQPVANFSPQDTIIGVKNTQELSKGTTIGNVSITIQGYQKNQRELALEVARNLKSLA